MQVNRVRHLPSPITGEPAPEVKVDAQKGYDALQALRFNLGALAPEIRAEKQRADTFVALTNRLLAQGPANVQLPPTLNALLQPAAAGYKQELLKAQQQYEAASQVIARTHDAIKEIGSVIGDGLVTELELSAVGRALPNMEAVLDMREHARLLDRGIADRLQTLVFGPLERLVGSLQQCREAGMQQLRQRDEAALNQRLDTLTPRNVTYQHLNLEDLANKSISLTGMERYQRGDLIAVPRTDGSRSLGVVLGKTLDGQLQVEFRTGTELVIKTMSKRDIANANPLKIGDYLEWKGKQIWITGLGANGQLTAMEAWIDARGKRRVRTVDGMARSGADHDYVRNLTKALVAATRVGRKPEATQRVSQLQVAGGVESKRVECVKGRTCEAALFCDRGIGYKNFNEDAAVAGMLTCVDGGELVYAGAFDQAGGMGQAGSTGAASALAAEALRHAAQAIANGAEPRKALATEAMESAHHRIRQALYDPVRRKSTVTTACAGVVKDGTAHVVNVGDSCALLFSRDGTLKAQTEMHNLRDELVKQTGNPNVGLQYSALVQRSLGGDDWRPDFYRWEVEPGDYLVFASDGLADANLEAQRRAVEQGQPWMETDGAKTTRELGSILQKCTSAEEATEKLLHYAREHMQSGDGKKDNTTICVLHAT